MKSKKYLEVHGKLLALHLEARGKIPSRGIRPSGVCDECGRSDQGVFVIEHPEGLELCAPCLVAHVAELDNATRELGPLFPQRNEMN